jgi:ribonuclease HI
MQWSENLAYVVVDASLDQAGKAGAGLVFYTSSGQIQLIYYSPLVAATAFQAEAQALKLALRDWTSPYIQKPQKIFTDCKSLVDFMVTGEEDLLPCWWGARDAVEAFQLLRSATSRGQPLKVCFARRQHTTSAHTLANWARRTGNSYIGLPTEAELYSWGLPLVRVTGENFRPP